MTCALLLCGLPDSHLPALAIEPGGRDDPTLCSLEGDFTTFSVAAVRVVRSRRFR